MGFLNLKRAMYRGLMAVVIASPAAVFAFGILASDVPEADAGKSRAGRRPFRVDARMANKIELGRRLFYDGAVSRRGAQACVDCHDPEHGYSDPRRFSADERGLSPRHSQPILNTSNNPSTHWDGEFDTVEDAVTARIGRPLVTQYYGTDVPTPARPTTPASGPSRLRPSTRPPVAPGSGPIAGGTPSRPIPLTGTPLPPLVAPPRTGPRFSGSRGTITAAIDEAVAERLQDAGRYKDAFKAVYGTRKVTVAKIAEAMAAYCHSIESTDGPYDKYVHGDEDALGASAKRGLALFKEKGNCASCHSLAGQHALLTDYEYHNTGIVWERKLRESQVGEDVGRLRVSRDDDDHRAFKTPTLRDVALRAPYMHDGSLKTLATVVAHYNVGGSPNDPAQDKRIKPLGLTESEQADLVAFLGSLTGADRPGRVKKTWHARPRKQAFQFVSRNGTYLTGLSVTLTPTGNIAVRTAAGRDTSAHAPTPLHIRIEGGQGKVRVAPSAWTHYKVTIPDVEMGTAIPLVPDTLRSVTIKVPVEGRVRLTILASSPDDLPVVLTAAPTKESQDQARAPGPRIRGRATPASKPLSMVLRRVSAAPMKVGSRFVARYQGWVPTGWDAMRLYIHQLQEQMAQGGGSPTFTVDTSATQDLRIDLTAGR